MQVGALNEGLEIAATDSLKGGIRRASSWSQDWMEEEGEAHWSQADDQDDETDGRGVRPAKW